MVYRAFLDLTRYDEDKSSNEEASVHYDLTIKEGNYFDILFAICSAVPDWVTVQGWTVANIKYCVVE